VLDAVAPSAEDLIVTLGDYIDRGPDSRGVIERLVQLEGECQLRPLLGNHEVLFLSALDRPEEFHFWLACGGQATLASYGGAVENVPAEHVDFLRNCLRFFETEDFFFVHANYEARLPLDRQPDEVLYWKHLLYGVPPRHASGKTAVVGHTPQSSGQVLNLGHLLCLDTYCFGDGRLTALDLNTGETWQADKFGRR
jgi:serine/threonine protein phosphatase 1